MRAAETDLLQRLVDDISPCDAAVAALLVGPDKVRLGARGRLYGTNRAGWRAYLEPDEERCMGGVSAAHGHHLHSRAEGTCATTYTGQAGGRRCSTHGRDGPEALPRHDCQGQQHPTAAAAAAAAGESAAEGQQQHPAS